MKVLRDRCLICHNDRKAEGGYDLSRADKLLRPGDSGEQPVVAGDESKSEILRRVTSDDSSIRMPSDLPPLPTSEIEAIRRWIQTGPFFSEDNTESLIDLVEGKDSLLDLRSPPLQTSYSNRVPNALFAVDPVRNRVYVAGVHEVLVWDLSERRLLDRWTGLGRFIGAINVHSSGNLVAISSGMPSKNGAIHMVDLSRPGMARNVMNVSDVATSLAFSPTEPVLAIGGMDGSLKLIDTRLSLTLFDAPAHADQVLAIHWKSDGSEFMSGSRDRTARIYTFPSLELKAAYSGHERTVGSVAILDDGAITFDETGTLRLWSAGDSDRILTKRTGLPQRLQPLQFSNNTISWIDDLHIETVEISRREEEQEKKDDNNDEKKDDGKSKKKKKVYSFVSMPSIAIPSNAVASWGWNRGTGEFFVSTRDGMLHHVSKNQPVDSNEDKPNTSWRIYP